MHKMGEKLRILAVEDEEMVRQVLEGMLRDSYDVDMAECGENALELMKNNQYDLALIDIALPGRLNGLDLACRLRKNSPSTRIIFLTGLSLPPERQEAVMELGDDLLQKPFTLEDIEEAVERVMTEPTTRRA